MYDAQVKKVEGMSFSVVPFSALEALRLKAYLIRLFGPALGRILGSLDTSTLDIAEANLDGSKIGEALSVLFETLSEDVFLSTIKWLLKRVTVEIDDNGKLVSLPFGDDRSFESALDKAFQGRLFTIYPVLLFVLRVNYPDLFTLAGSFGTRLKTLMSQLPGGNASKS